MQVPYLFQYWKVLQVIWTLHQTQTRTTIDDYPAVSSSLQEHKQCKACHVNKLCHIYLYYMNTSEIPSELSRENFISSYVKITCFIIYIDTGEIPGFFLLLKKIISSSHAVKILFLSFTCEDIGVAIVTKMVTIAMVT